MVVSTFGDWLRRRGQSVQEYIQSGSLPLHWLMDKCCYRYHVFDNKKADITKNKRLKQEVNVGRKKPEGPQWRKDEKGARRKGIRVEADGRVEREQEQEQVRELLSKAEDMTCCRRTGHGASLFTCTKGWRRNGAAESRG